MTFADIIHSRAQRLGQNFYEQLPPTEKGARYPILSEYLHFLKILLTKKCFHNFQKHLHFPNENVPHLVLTKIEILEYTHPFSGVVFLKSCRVSPVSAGESGAQMAKEGDVRLSSPQKQTVSVVGSESLIRRRPRGPAQVSAGPRLPASPSGHRGRPISSSHGEALWP